MNLLNDIKEFLKDNEEHDLKIEIDSSGVVVYLEYDPAHNYEGNCIIPIKYSTLEGFAYVPDDEYRKLYNPTDCGIDAREIIIISKIMSYLEKHATDIAALCRGFNFEERENYKAKYEAEYITEVKHVI